MSYLFALVITLGILVTIHEWGHYIVARLCGVKVLRFSVGFGKPFLSRYNKQGTEFALAPIPLGGYVKMLDEREVEVPEHEKHLSFNAQPLWQRAAIVAAGPLINLLFAALVFIFLFNRGMEYQPIVFAEPDKGTPAYHAQIKSQMTLLSIDGKPVKDWQDVMYELAKFAGESASVELSVNDDGKLRALSLDVNDLFVEPEVDPRRQLGLLPWYPAVIGMVMENSSAELAGFQVQDKIISYTQASTFDGTEQAIDGWMHWVDIIRSHPERQLNVKLLRGTETKVLQITPQKRVANGQTFGQAGLGLDVNALSEFVPNQILQLSFIKSIGQGFYEVKRSLVLQLSLLRKMIVGKISPKHLGGPVTIAQGAEQSISLGLQSFLQFLAGFSIMLGLMNLLPIPVLDGGHLLFMAYEAITGKLPSEIWHGRLTVIGLVLLLSIMVFAIFNDLMRVL